MHEVNAEYVLTSIPVVLERILGYLPILDLYKAKGVCKSWNTSAENVIEMRKKIPLLEFLTIVEELDEDENFVKFKRSNKEMSWNKDSKKYNEFLDWKNNWTTLPKTGICVCLSENKKGKSANFEAENILRYWLPPQSQLLVLGSVDSVVCVDREQTSKENSVLDAKGLYNYLSFPSKPGHFSVDFLNLKFDHLEEDHDKFLKDASEELAHPDTKMVLLCEQLYQAAPFPHFHRDVLNPAARRGVVVIGCLFDSKIVYSPDGSYANKTNSLQDMVLMLFKGKNVRAASVLVGSHVDTLAGLESDLKKLQSSLVAFSNDCPVKCKNRTQTGYCDSCMSQTIGLVIACCSRADSCEWYDQESDEIAAQITRNQEQETFRNIIPNVPLLGTYGMGEIGDTINIESEHEMINPHDDLLRGESTVFAVVMLK